MKKYLLSFLIVFSVWGCNFSGADELSSAPGDFASVSPGGNGGNGPVAGVMTAGEWNDLNHWVFWREVSSRTAYAPFPALWGISPVNRVSLRLQDPQGQPLTDVLVELMDPTGKAEWAARTDHAGKAELWVNLLNDKGQAAISAFSLKVKGQQVPVPGNLKLFSEGINELTLPLAPATTRKIDVAFVVDATGSMGDELHFLKTELRDVISRVKADNPQVVVNMGAVFYRDRNDDYLTRRSPFSTDISKTTEFIDKQAAGGGGDFPEAVHTAFKEAVEDLQWSAQATARVMFLILDAPPHKNQAVFAQIQESVAAAARKGIRIIPVTASGINKETEFLMRLLAISTNGTYVFITNHSGVGGDHLEASV